jgi:small subunit ribosomal protein S6
MRAYELMIIVESEVDEEGVNAQIAKVTELVEADGGRIATTDNWGKKRFAYEINHKWEGTYVVFEILTEVSLDSSDRSLRLADDIVRHKIMRLPEQEAARRGLFGEAAAPASAE